MSRLVALDHPHRASTPTTRHRPSIPHPPWSVPPIPAAAPSHTSPHRSSSPSQSAPNPANVRPPSPPSFPCALLTRRPPALISRQFRPLSKPRIDQLLSSFPKLIPPGSQHTTVESADGTVRFVYQTVEDVFVVVVTNRGSNILQVSRGAGDGQQRGVEDGAVEARSGLEHLSETLTSRVPSRPSLMIAILAGHPNAQPRRPSDHFAHPRRQRALDPRQLV